MLTGIEEEVLGSKFSKFFLMMDDACKSTSAEPELATNSYAEGSAVQLRPASPELYIDPALERRVVV